MVALYDGNLRMADDAVGEVFAALQADERWDDAIILVTSDHGEAHLEHGVQGHNSTLYDEMLHIPFILRLPGGQAAPRVDTRQLVVLSDVVPTVLGWVGVEPRVEVDGIPYIRAVGRNSASGLYGEVNFHPVAYPWLEWTWRVDKLQKTADIRTKAGEDMAAAIFLLFGRPSWFRPEVPTLAYVWTNDKLPKGSVVLSPYHPGTVRGIVLESGEKNLGQWVSVRRNIVEDYLTAFGKEPPGAMKMIAVEKRAPEAAQRFRIVSCGKRRRRIGFTPTSFCYRNRHEEDFGR